MTYTYNGVEYAGYPGNHWSELAGVDADGNGLFDASYVLPNGPGTDHAPIRGAWENGVIVKPKPKPIVVDGTTFFNILAAADFTYTHAESDAGYSDRKPLLPLTTDPVPSLRRAPAPGRADRTGMAPVWASLGDRRMGSLTENLPRFTVGRMGRQ